MFVELGVQTSLTMLDNRWVGNWWLGFAIFGAICVFWSIWLLGFPKEFPLTKKQREKEVVGYVCAVSHSQEHEIFAAGVFFTTE